MVKSVIFLHRSVGNNLVHDGKMYELLRDCPDISFADFDQNTRILRDTNSSRTTDYIMPGDNTTPRDYAELFSGSYSPPFKDFVMAHDVIIIKSCYPNSNIKSADELQTIKGYYRSIAAFFAKYHDRVLIIMTSPPLVPFMTNAANAKRARELAMWLSREDFGPHIRVFDFFDLLADDSGNHANMLRKGYRRLVPFDSHPNKLASQTIAPQLINFIL